MDDSPWDDLGVELLPTKGPRRRPVVLDQVDRRIIASLMRNGRLRARVLAQDIGVTEATIAARMRSLVARRLLGITAVIDWKMAGYDLDLWLSVTTRARPLGDVGQDLARLDGVHSVSLVFGPVDYVVHGLVASGADGVDRLVARASEVDGVSDVEIHTSIDTLRYTAQYARLPIEEQQLDLPLPQIPVDEIDRSMIELLMADGRRSNREIARALNVSEGTVRSRLRRLEEVRLLRIVGQSDPYLTGLVNTWTYTWVDVEDGAAPLVAEQLASLAEAFVVSLVSGRHDLLLGLFASSKSGLIRTISETVRSIPEVIGTETWEVVRTIHYKFPWVRLL